MANKYVLIVEDQAQAAQVVMDGLASLGAAISARAVASAEAALRALESEPVDLLIADVLLPGISGLELMARFRKRNPATRVILLSSVRDPEIRKQVARSGADAFFFKPAELADILDAVERQLGLVKSILPSELSVVRNSDDLSEGIAQQLAELRFNLQAQSVFLVAPQGQVLARAGVLPEPHIEAELVPLLLNAARSAAHIAILLKAEGADDLLLVRGAQHHIHFTNAGQHLLAVVTKPLPAARQAALAEALARAITRLSLSLQPQRAQSAPASAPSETDPQLERLLELAETKPTSRHAVERFWQPQELPPLAQPGALSYAQAAQIGLAPAED